MNLQLLFIREAKMIDTLSILTTILAPEKYIWLRNTGINKNTAGVVFFRRQVDRQQQSILLTTNARKHDRGG